MEQVILNFTANGQQLTSENCPYQLASKTVNYIKAVFELGDGWDGFESVRAVWFTGSAKISTVLSEYGACVVPHEVLTYPTRVKVNLVGSNTDGDVLTDRLTSYPIVAIKVDADSIVEGTETEEITPSQFDQYVAVIEEMISGPLYPSNGR